MTVNHPFIQPLDELTIDELDKKYADLISRWRAAKSMNMPNEVLYQLDLMLNSIESEKDKRLTTEDRPNGVVIDTDPIEGLTNVPSKTIVKDLKKD